MKKLCLSLVLALLVAPAALAEKLPYALDRSHCQLNFIGEALLLSAHGFFERWDADVQIDRENLENSSVTFTIEAASLNTRVERRDNHLRNADFLDVANHPRITFVSTRVTGVDEKNLLLSGDLTLRGVTKSIQVPVRIVFMREGDGRFKGEFQINRKDYGINYNSRMNPVEDMVTIQFDLHLMDRAMMEARQRQQQQRNPAQSPPSPR